MKARLMPLLGAVLLASLLLSSQSMAQEVSKRLSQAEAEADTRQFFSTLQRVHPDLLAKVTLDDYVKLKKQTVEDACKRLDADGTISVNDLAYVLFYAAAYFGDGHTQVQWRFQPNESNTAGKRFPPFLLDYDNGHFVITASSDESIEGMEVVSVDGKPIREFLRPILDRCSGETLVFKASRFTHDQCFWYTLSDLFGSAPSITLGVRAAPDEESEQQVETVGLPDFQRLASDAPAGKLEELRRQGTHVRFLDSDRIAHFVYPGFVWTEDEKKKIDGIFEEIKAKKSRKLIIDLRGNGGGTSNMGDFIFSYLYDEEFVSFSKIRVRLSRDVLSSVAKGWDIPESADIDGLVVNWHPKESFPKPQAFFSGQAFLLVDNSTFSAAADFTAMFRDYGVGTIIGYETGGLPVCFGDIYPFNLENSGIGCGVSWKQFFGPKPRPGDDEHGVIPDIPMTDELLRPYQSEDDPVLAFTIDHIKKARRTSPATTGPAERDSANGVKADAMPPLEPVSVKKNSLVIAVDPRVEILSIVQYLSHYGKTLPHLVTRRNHSYRKDTDEWFSGFKSHPVIEMFNRMSSAGFNYDAPPHAALALNMDLSPGKTYFEDAYAIRRAGGKEQATAFANALRAFAVESRFADFYTGHIPFYKRITEETAKNVEDKDVIQELELYYGEKKGSYTVVISPLLGGGAFGCTIHSECGAEDVYSIMGPRGERDGTPLFGSADAFHHLQWHEFGHSFVNPLTEKHGELCEKRSSLFPPMEGKMKKQAYGDWYSVVNESVIRAVTTRLAYRLDGPDAGDRERQSETGRGFVFTDALVKKLEEYEQNRGKYPTLDSFYPELLKALDGFSESSVEALLALNAVLTINGLSREARSVVYEVPDDEGRAAAVRFIGRMHDRFFKKLELIDAAKLDDSALKDKLKGNFVLYTTMADGTGLFRATTEHLGIQIDEGTFHWNGVTAPAGELRVILVGRNPYGEGNCVVYAAGSTRLLDGINGVFHGPCAYHIFQGDRLLKEGHYDQKSVLPRNP